MKSKGTKLITIILIFIFLATTNISFAVTQSEIDAQKNQQKETDAQIKEVEQKKQEVEEEKSDTMKEVEKLSDQIAQYESQIDELDVKIGEANQKITDATNKLNQAQEDYEQQQKSLEDRIVALYESGDVTYLDVLLSSESVTDFISNYYIVSEIAQYDVDLLDSIDKKKKEIENAKTELENSKQELVTTKASKEQVSTQLKSSKAEKDSKVADLSEQEKELQAEIDELQAANVEMTRKIKEAEKQYQAQLEELKKQANNNSGSSSGNSGSSNGGSNSSGGSGYFQRPVATGSITAGWYYPSGKFHGAVDYGVPVGTPVYAAAAGVVMSTANLSGSYGTYVVIRHANGLQSYYAHGTYGSICVSPGQTVSKGQQIMKSGNTGNSSGPHLHFEVRVSPYSWSSSGGDSRVNPLSYL